MACQSVLEEIFTEDEMLVIHRVHMEMENAKTVDAIGPALAPDLLWNEAFPKTK